MLTLYDYFRSSACFRVRIALNLKKLTHETIPIHLIKQGGEQFSLEYKKINPHSLVPALQDDDKLLTQSIAIIEYLDEVYPQPALLPQDPYQKALVRAFALSIAADLHPLNNLRVLTYLTNEFNISEEKKIKWYQHWATKGLAALEKQLVSYGTATSFCFADEPSMADICLIPQLYNARRFYCDLHPYPTLTRIDANCRQIRAFHDAWPIEETV